MKNPLKERQDAFAAAKRIAGGNLQAATAVMLTAEIDAMRTLLAKMLPGGEAEYWRKVREEIER